MVHTGSARDTTIALNGSLDLLPEDFEDIHVLFLNSHDCNVIHSATAPVRTFEDAAGMKLRAPSRNGAQVNAGMGAKPVGLPELASMILWALVATSQIAARHRMLDPITIGVIGPVFIFGMLILRMPVGIAIIAVGISGIWILGQTVSYIRFVPRLRQYKSLLWEYVANYDSQVVPLLVLMGYIAAEARLSSDLIKDLQALMQSLRGGVAMAAVAACGGFGAVCGSSLAAAATMGKVALILMLSALALFVPRLIGGQSVAGLLPL